MKPSQVCSYCGATTFLMFTMAGGKTLGPWVLCSSCWRQGLSDKRKESDRG